MGIESLSVTIIYFILLGYYKMLPTSTSVRTNSGEESCKQLGIMDRKADCAFRKKQETRKSARTLNESHQEEEEEKRINFLEKHNHNFKYFLSNLKKKKKRFYLYSVSV